MPRIRARHVPDRFRPGIANRDEDAVRLRLLGADQQLSRPRLDRAHCFDRIQDQVQHGLLQLNTIPLNGKQPLDKTGKKEAAE
jgi:hypothetical protein